MVATIMLVNAALKGFNPFIAEATIVQSTRMEVSLICSVVLVMMVLIVAVMVLVVLRVMAMMAVGDGFVVVVEVMVPVIVIVAW